MLLPLSRGGLSRAVPPSSCPTVPTAVSSEALGCTKHVAKEDRAIASECAEPKVHSSTSPAHPRALRASQRVVLAPSTPFWQQHQGG